MCLSDELAVNFFVKLRRDLITLLKVFERHNVIGPNGHDTKRQLFMSFPFYLENVLNNHYKDAIFPQTVARDTVREFTLIALT